MSIKVQTTDSYIKSCLESYDKKHGKNSASFGHVPPVLIDKTSVERYTELQEMEEK